MAAPSSVRLPEQGVSGEKFASVQERWRSLTTATCTPASNSASISARDLYCCGDSITISLLGALPARPCMVGSLLPVSCPVGQLWVSLQTSCHGTKLPCSTVNGERSPGCPVILPLHSITITPSLSLCCSDSHQNGRAPPTLSTVQLWVWICVHVF